MGERCGKAILSIALVIIWTVPVIVLDILFRSYYHLEGSSIVLIQPFWLGAMVSSVLMVSSMFSMVTRIRIPAGNLERLQDRIEAELWRSSYVTERRRQEITVWTQGRYQSRMIFDEGEGKTEIRVLATDTDLFPI